MLIVVNHDCGGYGDSLLLAPALDLLRRARPDARIAVACHPGVGEWFVEAGLADMALNRTRPLPQAEVLLGISRRPRSWRREHAHRAGVIAAVPALGAPGIHQAHHLESVVRAALPLWEPYREAVLPASYADPAYAGAVILAPGASMRQKVWPHFAELAAQLERAGIRVVVLRQDPPLPGYEKLAGDFLTIAPTLAGARAVVGNDSMAVHLAALAGGRPIALFGPSQPAHWRPIGPHVSVLHGCPQLSARPAPTTSVLACRAGDCWSLLPPERVLHHLTTPPDTPG